MATEARVWSDLMTVIVDNKQNLKHIFPDRHIYKHARNTYIDKLVKEKKEVFLLVQLFNMRFYFKQKAEFDWLIDFNGMSTCQRLLYA